MYCRTLEGGTTFQVKGRLCAPFPHIDKPLAGTTRALALFPLLSSCLGPMEACRHHIIPRTDDVENLVPTSRYDLSTTQVPRKQITEYHGTRSSRIPPWSKGGEMSKSYIVLSGSEV
jgi:hypothetical protein